MKRDEDRFFKKIDNIKDAMMGLLTIYGPQTKESILNNIGYYFPQLIDECEDFINELLKAFCDAQLISKSNNKYSVIPFYVIKKIKEAIKVQPFLPIGKKEFDAKQIVMFGSNINMAKGKGFEKLKEYLQKQITNKKQAEDIQYELVYYPYLLVESEEAFRIVCNKTKAKLDKERFIEYYNEYSTFVPRYFLGGFSFSEYNQEVKKLYPIYFNKKEDNKIKIYPHKKNYPKFSYLDLIELAKKVSNAQIYKLIDSDRILEFTINGKKVYTQVLGFYHKNVGIIIYPNIEELKYSYHFSLSDISTYPDMPLRMSVIEVCLDDPGGFANDKVLYDMKKNNYPEYPSFIRLQANHYNRLVNDEEIQIVGGVLSDLLTYIKTNELSDISMHLGEKKDDDYDIDQVYITDEETIYGGYNDIELENAFLNFKIKPIDKNKIKNLKKYKKADISLGCYIYPAIIENDELPYMFVVRDDRSGMIVDMFLKRIDEMPNIKNDFLDLLNKKQICPEKICVNNQYTFAVFEEFIDYFNYDYTDDNQLNDIYNEANSFESSQSEKADRRKFS